jgi:hypothetical protein
MMRHAAEIAFRWTWMDRIQFRSREVGSVLSVPLICALRSVRSGASLFHKFHNLRAPLQALLLRHSSACWIVLLRLFENSKSCSGPRRAPPTVTVTNFYLLGLYKKYDLHIETTNTLFPMFSRKLLAGCRSLLAVQ